jgi:hypothetical protein
MELWAELLAALERECGADGREWWQYEKNAPATLWVTPGGRAIVYLTPGGGAFRAWLAMGKRALA